MRVMNSKDFTYVKESRTFVADASDVEYKGYQFIALQSARTGKVADFELSETCKLKEELWCWVFLPTLETLQKSPELAGVTVKIFND